MTERPEPGLSPFAGLCVVAAAATGAALGYAVTLGLSYPRAMAVIILVAAAAGWVALAIAIGVTERRHRVASSGIVRRVDPHTVVVAVPTDHPEAFYREQQQW